MYFRTNGITNNNIVVPTGLPSQLRNGVEGMEHATVGGWKDSTLNCLIQIIPSCCMSFYCSCVMAGQISQKLNVMQCRYVVLLFVIVYFLIIILDLAAIGALILWLMLAIFALILRLKTREILRIPGNVIVDFIISVFCTSCTLAQVSHE